MANCKVIGVVYIVLVTISAFNMTAMTINESYHFSNRIANTKIRENLYCVMFGLSITWITSIIINLGIAFVPDNSSLNEMVSQLSEHGNMYIVTLFSLFHGHGFRLGTAHSCIESLVITCYTCSGLRLLRSHSWVQQSI